MLSDTDNNVTTLEKPKTPRKRTTTAKKPAAKPAEKPKMKSTPADKAVEDKVHKAVKAVMQKWIAQINAIESERADLGFKINEILSEAASQGYSRKHLKMMAKLSRQTQAERDEELDLFDQYRETLGF